jgi:hypothetical protein
MTTTEQRAARGFAERHHAEHDPKTPQNEPLCRWCHQHALEDAAGVPRMPDAHEPVYTGVRIYCHWCKHPLEEHGSLDNPVDGEVWEGDSGCTDLAGPLYGDGSDGLRDRCRCPYGPDGRIHRA